MLFTMLKGKLHRAVVTVSNKDYEGSVAIDTELMKAANILPYEQVDIYNITSGERFTTYAIPADPALDASNKGMIGIQGAAAHKAKVGDLVIICAYAQMSEDEAASHIPSTVLLDGTMENQPN